MDVDARIIEVVNRINGLGINQGSSGNASVRQERDGVEGLLITPSGIDYPSLEKEDLVFMPLEGEGAFSCDRPGRRPSSEWRFHLDILARRPDVDAVLHTHAVHSTALASMRKGIPPFHYMVAIAGGHDIRCSGYATFGTQALSDLALEALTDRKACLLGNHGLITCGTSLDQALALAIEVDALAAMYLKILAAGEPVLLSAEEMDDALRQFREGYGSGD